ncbi:serine protease inhibitor 3 [Nomia melanderi]|uniref:serine protease inhibitor 3 n=1 Tax=Nomia melanderi TaxID=2448451 RepID=UPI0013041E25|nr:serine protease inhibitor 3-like [Nomia melanderi]
MWTKVFALFLVFAIVASIPIDVEPTRKCVTGKRYFDGCNWCFCAGDGVTGCTLMACVKYNPETGEMESVNRSLPPPEDYWEA